MSEQKPIPAHPLTAYGHHRLPFWLWRRSRLLHDLVAKARDVWLIVSGRCSLHIAWQQGYNDGHRDEYTRIVVNGGDIAGKVWSREHQKLLPDNRAAIRSAP